MPAHVSAFAWVVLIPEEKYVSQALVSAQALQMVGTGAHVVALVPSDLSPENMAELASVFEMVVVRRKEDGPLLRATWTLSSFSRVLVIQPGLVLRRQSDHLFDVTEKEVLVTGEDGSWMVVQVTPHSHQSARTIKKLSEFHNLTDAAVAVPLDPKNLENWTEHPYYFAREQTVQQDFLQWQKCREQYTPTPRYSAPEDKTSHTKDWIAVVGMACRFPGANNLQEYWNLLEQGQNTCSTQPQERHNMLEALDGGVRGNWLKCALDQFDAQFFGLSPSEMAYTDPQARLLLETSWEALEHANINPELMRKSKTGVFSGIWLQDYKEVMNAQGSQKLDLLRKYLGNSFGSTAAKLSFFYGMTGPNVSTESGCSSSLVALHLAATSLLRRECPVALVCGANVILQAGRHPKIWSEDGLSKTFDQGADGYSRAEGVAVLVLKRYADALRDGDEIQGVIRGGATAQEGESKSFGAPTVDSEWRCMRDALANARVDPGEVDFLEAHATGTAVGDPIEAAAILKAYATPEKRTSPLWISSGKTNIGHTESVSGLAGVIKVLLAMQHNKIPAHLNFSKLNPKIDFSPISGAIPLEAQPWPRNPGRVRIAGVSSFGITGTDVHIILQEPPQKVMLEEESNPPPPQMLLLSAKSPVALESLVQRYFTHLDKTKDKLSDICFTAAACRPHHAHRTAYLARNVEELRQKLKTIPEMTECSPQSPSRVCFTFPGRIGKMDLTPISHLYRDNAYFRRVMNHCDGVFREMNPSAKHGLVDTLLNDKASEQHKSWEWYSLLPTYQYALAKLWRHWGVEPTLVVGHCLGEISAALTSGALSLSDAYRLLQVIPKLMAAQEKAPAAMMALERDAPDATALIDTFLQNQPPIPKKFWLDVACCNGRRQTVIAGPSELIPEFARFCQQNGARAMTFSMDFCAHSRAVDAVVSESQALFQQLNFRVPEIPYLSSYTGKLLDISQSTTRLSGQEFAMGVLRNSVRFTEACETLATLEMADVYLEMGVDGSLSKLTRGNLARANKGECLPSFLGESASLSAELRVEASLASLYTLGGNPDWIRVYESSGRKNFERVPLPGYPFQRKSFWFERKTGNGKEKMAVGLEGISLQNWLQHALLGRRVQGPLIMEQGSSVVAWQNDFFQHGLPSLPQTSFVGDHIIGGEVIFPGAGFLEMMLSCCKSTHQTVHSFKIHAPLYISRGDQESPLQVQTVWNPEKGQVSVYSCQTGASWRLQATAQVAENAQESKGRWDQICAEIGQQTAFTEEEMASATTFYEAAAQVELQFGPTFQSITALRHTPSGDLIARVKDCEGDPFTVHPLLLDAMIQTAMIHQRQNPTQLYVPVRLGSFVYFPVASEPSSPPPQHRDWFVYSTENGTTLYLVDPWGRIRGQMTEPELVATSVKAIFQAAGVPQTREAKGSSSEAVTTYTETWEPTPFHQPCTPQGELGNTKVMDEQLVQSLERQNMVSPEEHLFDQKINRLCELYVAKALLELGCSLEQCPINPEVAEQLGVVSALVPAFRHFLTFLPPEVLEMQEVNKEIEEILQDPTISDYPALTTLTACGSQLAGILNGRVTAQELLFDRSTRLAEHYYQHTRFRAAIDAICHPVMLPYLRQMVDACQPLRILEVGAGTGACARIAVPELQSWNTPFEYHFTDLSATLVAHARQNLFPGNDVSNSVIFSVLDVEQEPLAQGFPPHYFDMVVCINVLHATGHVSHSLEHLSRLCKPGGVLVLGETVKPVKEVDICFGGMDGYWNFADPVRLQQGHCTLSADQWLGMLDQHGFSREQHSFPTANHQMAVITATKERSAKAEQPEAIWVLFHSLPQGKEMQKMAEFSSMLTTCAGRTVKVFGISPQLEGDALTSFIKQELSNVNFLEGIQVWLDDGQSSSRGAAEPLLAIAQYLIAAKPKLLPRLQLITNSGSIAHSPFYSLALGLMRNVRIELPGIKAKSVELSGSWKAEWLLTEMWLEDRETEVEYRGEEGRRLVRRLRVEDDSKKPVSIELPPTGEYRVTLPNSKLISDVSFTSLQEPSVGLGEEEVRVEVRCVSLNFRDVMAVLKPSEKFEMFTSIGLDYSGVVAQVGGRVTRWKEGDSVFGCSWDSNATRSHLIAHELDLEEVPAHLTFAEAATLPAVFVTAWLCLVNVAKVKKGQTVLVHAASGGVGLAVIQLAQLLGFHIIGTAGSERKRQFLQREMGITHVFNSRTTDFEEQVREATNGNGVDIVLNCLTGPGFKEASLAVCRDGGYFVEISKLNIWSESEVKELRPLVKYSVVDASTLPSTLAREIIAKIKGMVETRELQPLPHVQFPASQLPSALTYLQKAQQIGKVIVNMPVMDPRVGVHVQPLFNARSTYLITGGKGAIGWAVGKWMVERGARYLLLAGRSPPRETLLQEIRALEQEYNAHIVCKELDIADYEQLRHLIQHEIPNQLHFPPLRGIHHAAGILSDKAIAQQDWPNFESVLRPKVNGSWNLHLLTKDLLLEHFVLHSSAATTCGHAGQSNYVAANAFMDNLASQRRASNLPALSINWGQWKTGLAEHVQLEWLQPFTLAEGITALEGLVTNPQYTHYPQPSNVITGHFNFRSALGTMPFYKQTFLKHVLQEEASPTAAGGGKKAVGDNHFVGEYKAAKTSAEKKQLLRNFILHTISETLGLPEKEIGEAVSLSDMGMDSLMSIEFSNKIISGMEDLAEGGALGGVSNIDLQEHGTLVKLTDYMFTNVLGEKETK